jgi:uncharacterized membrane protein
MTMSLIGTIHVAASLASLASGGTVLASRKGTRFHRTVGGGYVTAMVIVNASALCIYRLTGHFEPFHALALGRGMAAALIRRPGWPLTHYRGMAWSYLGLVAAACAEIGVRVLVAQGFVGHSWHIIAAGVAVALVFSALGIVILPRLRRTAVALSAAT